MLLNEHKGPWIGLLRAKKTTKQTEGNNVLCHRLLCVPDLTTSNIVFISNSIMIYDLENVFTRLILSESCKHVTEKGQAKILSSCDLWGN